jgi:hypothetical protein
MTVNKKSFFGNFMETCSILVVAGLNLPQKSRASSPLNCARSLAEGYNNSFEEYNYNVIVFLRQQLVVCCPKKCQSCPIEIGPEAKPSKPGQARSS